MRVTTMFAATIVGLLAVLPTRAQAPFPDQIELPNGFAPEGIEIHGQTFFVGSIPTGDIYSGDLRTGEGDILVDAPSGRAAVGLGIDQRGRLFVAGGSTGDGYVYNSSTGATLATFDFASATTFVNDVVVTQDAAWFTDSQKAVLYRVPIAPNGDLGTFEVVPLSGDFQLTTGFNLNGIDATANGKTLVVVQSNTATLFRVTPEGVTTEIDLGGESVPNGDGILLHGTTLYVVQNRLNLVAVIELSPDLASGEVVERVGNDDFSVPTTVAKFGNSLYFVNARFGVTPAPTEFWVTRMDRP